MGKQGSLLGPSHNGSGRHQVLVAPLYPCIAGLAAAIDIDWSTCTPVQVPPVLPPWIGQALGTTADQTVIPGGRIHARYTGMPPTVWTTGEKSDRTQASRTQYSPVSHRGGQSGVEHGNRNCDCPNWTIFDSTSPLQTQDTGAEILFPCFLPLNDRCAIYQPQICGCVLVRVAVQRGRGQKIGRRRPCGMH